MAVILLFSCVVLITLYIMFSNRMSAPIRKVREAMKEVEGGQMDVHLDINTHDEMEIIADGFNKMVEKLQDYINQVYVAQICQKDAELNALKMQIQPHYLYNTLDVIRMTALDQLKPLEKEDIKTLLHRALEDMEKGMGAYRAVADEDALEFLADVSNGDARSALNAIELGILTTERSADGLIHITLDVASECIQKRVIKYDKNGDSHYDNISAFIKSMRGSDPDAAVYYLAKMLYAGEDVTFIARRIMICASEDVGNADPNALTVAVSAAQAVERLGMPEARIVLAQAVTYVASAPKSNAAYLAVDKALSVVRESRTAPVPTYLCDAHYKGAAKLGRGLGYKYAHDYPNHYVEQQYLPDAYKDMKFYEPTENGYEQTIREYLKKIKQE